jgi:2-hydroxycyclohexanecarboxyl-CoA dehydrogenase
MNRLKDRVALVTGGAGGIGRAIVQRLALDGAKVVLADIDEDGAKSVANGLALPDLWPMTLDITRPEEVRDSVAKIQERWNRIDVLVNNAGRTRVGVFMKSREEHWEELFHIDVMGLLRCTQSVLPGMLDRRWGRIINIASDAALAGLAGQAVYSAAKGAVIAFTKSLARETASSGVLVNAVSPGPVNTPPLQRLFERQPQFAAKLTAEIPIGRVAEPDEVAAAVAFLASDDSRYITGQVLSVNGGWVM